MHIHVLGNKGVNCVVSAFVNGGKDEMRNTLVHVRNVNPEDYKRMADNNIYVSSGITWHHGPAGMAEYFCEHKSTPIGQESQSYPFKSFFDKGIPVSIHSDYPVMEIHSAKPTATYFEGEKVFTAQKTLSEVKAELRAQYGENKKITDGNYDKSLAVKCVNGTFVGKKNDGVIAYKGIPFVGEQPL